MPSIDERVVAMSFENGVFEARVATTMGTLGKLDIAIKNIGSTSGLHNIEADANKVTLQQPMSALDKLKAKLGGAGQGAAQGFNDIERAANKVGLEGPSSALDKLKAKFGQLNAGSTFTDIEKAADRTTLSGLTNALDNVTNKFSVLQGAASVALGGIAAQAAMKGAAFGKSFAFGPITQGLQEYQTNLNSIQTILSNTQGQQVSGLQATNKYLGELNKYSDQTIYSFSEMAKNIGTFTAAGVDLPRATESIKGIANLAAASGSSSQQAATAMYQLSQAISAGRVGLQDWNSVVNAGMGGALFQKALMRTGENMGAIAKGAVKVDKATGKATINGKSFRESIMAKPGEQSWLTGDVLTKTLEQFTGDLSDAELKAQGFTDAQIKSIQATAKTAKEAATQVKTLPQVFDVAKETIGSGWAQTFQLIFGNFDQAKKTFTGLSNAINGFINNTSKARNNLLQGWSDLNGRQTLIVGLKNAFAALGAILKPIHEAFREIFPPTTAHELVAITASFRDLMANLKIGPETADGLRRTFAGLFAVLHIGWTIVKEVAGVIFDLLGVVGQGSGGFLNFTGSIGDFLVSLDKAISSGQALHGFFSGLSSVLSAPLHILQALSTAFFNLFQSGGDNTKLTDRRAELLQFGKVLTPMERIINRVTDAWRKLVDILGGVKDALSPWLTQVTDQIKSFADTIGNALDNADWDTVFAGVQTGILAALFLAIKKAIGGKGIEDIGGGLLSNVNGILKGVTANLTAMQTKLKAETLLLIAGAIGVLAGAILVLSRINSDDLGRAMTAVAIGLGELMGAMKLMTSGMGLIGVLQLPVIAAGMVGLAFAVVILAGAMKIMSTMSWEDIAKGLVGVGGALAAVGAATHLISGPQILATGLAMIPLAIGINLLAAAVKQFAQLKWADLGKGLIGMAVALGAVAMGMSLMPPNLLLTGAGLIAVGIGVSALAGAVKAFGSMDIKVMVQGLLGLAAALVAIGLAVIAIPPTVALQAAGLVILAVALNGIASAIKIFGSMDVGELVKGIIAMGAALNVLAEGLYLMSGTLAGSAALLGAAVALAILAPTLAFLGTLKWGTIFKGLAAIALALGTLALVGALAAAPLGALGVALLPLAGVFVLTAGAVFIFAKALSLLGAEGGKGVAVMITALTAFVALLPTIVINFIKGLVQIAQEVAKVAPQVLTAIGTMLDAVIQFVIAKTPSLALAIGTLVDGILQVLLENVPNITAAGFTLLLGLLSGIAGNIQPVVASAVTIITRFLASLTAAAPKLVASGVKTMIAFLTGIISQIPRLVETVGKLITKFIDSVAAQIPRIVASGIKLIVRFLNAIASQIGNVIKAGVNIILKFMDGIQQAIPRVAKKALSVARTFMNTMADTLVGLVDIGFKAIIRFLHGIADSIRTNRRDLFDAGLDIAKAIVEGIVEGLGWVAQKVVRPIIDKLFSWLPDKIKHILGIHSPSRVFALIGEQTMMGFVVGVQDSQPAMAKSMENAASTVVDAAKSSFGKVPNLLEGVMDTNPVITPVLDLSQVKKDAQQLGDMSNVVPITAAASFDQASAASQEVSAAQQSAADAAAAKSISFEFNQTNTSPEALSDVEIYRQTKNQLGQVKKALGLVS